MFSAINYLHDELRNRLQEAHLNVAMRAFNSHHDYRRRDYTALAQAASVCSSVQYSLLVLIQARCEFVFACNTIAVCTSHVNCCAFTSLCDAKVGQTDCVRVVSMIDDDRRCNAVNFALDGLSCL